MRIAIFSDIYLGATGGIVSSIKAQKNALEKAGHEVVIFSPASSNFRQQNLESGVVIVPTCRYWKVGGVPIARRPEIVKKWIEGGFGNLAEFDVVHVHYEAGCSLAGMQLAKKYQKPLIVTMHGREDVAVATNIPYMLKTVVGSLLCWLHAKYIPHDIKISLDNYLATTRARAKMWQLMINHANYADLVIVPSRHFRKKLEHYGVKRTVEVLSNGIAEELVPKKVSVVKWHLDEPLKLFWNSRVSKEKRIMDFLQALSLVQFPVEMMVFGEGNDLKKAQRFVRKKGLKVKFFGVVPREKLLKNMQQAKMSVLVSYGFDTQGMTLLEAEAFGVPVLICDPDLKETVARGGCVCCDPKAEKMAMALIDLHKHPEQIAKMSRAMIKDRKKVMVGTMLESLVRIYKKAIEISGAKSK